MALGVQWVALKEGTQPLHYLGCSYHTPKEVCTDNLCKPCLPHSGQPTESSELPLAQCRLGVKGKLANGSFEVAVGCKHERCSKTPCIVLPECIILDTTAEATVGTVRDGNVTTEQAAPF